jgi:outer membrane protein assembly factor BamA
VRYRRAEAVTHHDEAAWQFQTEYFERMQLRTGAFVAYPFSRGLRVEFSGGMREAAYRRDLRSQIASVSTGKVVESSELRSSGGASTTLGEVGAALVHDTTMYGPTGPLLGSRYRIEVMPTVGELSFMSVTTDVRKYVMPVRPCTLGVRLLHSARYGRDGNDPRLLSNYLGSNYFVRGHHNDLSYCVPAAEHACGDDLFGSRLLVGNVELRVPLWGIRSRQLEYGPVPIDAIAFADGGQVWDGGARATRITSVGGGFRINAFGLPVELTATRATDGPRPRWFLDFGFRTGF